MSIITRRGMLLGAAAMLGAGTLVNRRQARAGTDRPPRRLIIVMAEGGWDPTAVLDPKPGLTTIDALPGDVQEFAGLPVYVDGTRPAVTSFFQAHAALCTVVNGIQVQSLNHPDCAKRMLTGTPSDTNADMGAMTAHALEAELAAPYLVLGRNSFSGPYASISARAGTANQLGTLLAPERAYPVGSPADFTPRLPLDATEEDLIRAHVLGRAEDRLAARGQIGENQRRLQDFVDAIDRADVLAATADFGDFGFTGDLSFQAQLAVDALEQGLSFAAQIELGSFDTHENNLGQIPLQDAFYAGLQALVDDLAARPGMQAGQSMIDDTVVLVVSEMGRTPKLNSTGGKDHWPVTSAMLIGGGLPGGRVLGGTDELLYGRTVDLATGEPDDGGVQIQYGNFAAGLLQAVGVDAATYLPGEEPFHALCG
ncbi:DUF1501 domain-containing protein [Paraliomyxa miuraensis]|uniref:DUF1501 domain-containing protein n=1 Tax=Paraliomyxa miuraensis TaxID=376150 RepID=UPI002259F584|nr:DUF1501 domain-containing protein [Paraliomyxa miuraensis]MCX4241217.1 DUF1501 domain-containing protein [Paraliomyxa miuraensis]